MTTTRACLHPDGTGAAIWAAGSPDEAQQAADFDRDHPDGQDGHERVERLFQSHWMATKKTTRHWPAALHACTYGLPFLLLRPSLAALAVIVGSHFVIDRWRLARQLVWAKNQLAPVGYRWPWKLSADTGYPPNTPPWLATWLLIIADNTLHVLVNAAALEWL